MIPFSEALRRVLEAAGAAGPVAAEDVPLEQAARRVCARDARAEEPVPGFDNSAMDGYAVAAERTAGAKAAEPVVLDIVGAVYAGDEPPCAARPGAWEITTGAALPAGCDAIVRVEDAERLEGGRAVTFSAPAEPGDYVRRAGSDFASGDLACKAGELIDARRLLALAAAGAGIVSVRRKPRVALFSTGKELVEPSCAPRAGQVRNATGVFLAASLRALGAEVEDCGVAADEPKDFVERLHRALAKKPDVVITTGAVSMGRFDFIPYALAELKAKTLFHKTAIRPGKPVLAASLPGGALFFGLPGNPVSTAVGLRFLVAPALRALLGRPAEEPLRARVAERFEKTEGLRCFLKAKLERRGALLEARVLEGQGSHQIKPLLSADAWLVAPEAGAAVEAGTELDAYTLLP